MKLLEEGPGSVDGGMQWMVLNGLHDIMLCPTLIHDDSFIHSFINKCSRHFRNWTISLLESTVWDGLLSEGGRDSCAKDKTNCLPAYCSVHYHTICNVYFVHQELNYYRLAK